MGRFLEPLFILVVIGSIVYAGIASLNEVGKVSNAYMIRPLSEWTDYQVDKFITRPTWFDPKDEITKELDELTDFYLESAKELYDLPFLTNVKVTHGLKSRKTLGIAVMRRIDGELVNLISYNHALISLRTPEDREDVVAHEVAHLIAFHKGVGDEDGHGPTWEKYCKSLLPTGKCREKI